MIICEPTFSEIADNRLFQKVERCGRVCYKSEDKITDDSAYKFVKNICSNNHGSVLEHYNFFKQAYITLKNNSCHSGIV